MKIDVINIDGLILNDHGIREEQLVSVLEIMQREISDLKVKNHRLEEKIISIDLFLSKTDYRYSHKEQL
jgi:hypothetical protein